MLDSINKEIDAGHIKLLILTLAHPSASEFVEMLFSAANGISEKEKKTTITPEHVLAAIEQLEMTNLKEPIASFMQTLKETKGKHKPIIWTSSRSHLPCHTSFHLVITTPHSQTWCIESKFQTLAWDPLGLLLGERNIHTFHTFLQLPLTRQGGRQGQRKLDYQRLTRWNCLMTHTSSINLPLSLQTIFGRCHYMSTKNCSNMQVAPYSQACAATDCNATKDVCRGKSSRCWIVLMLCESRSLAQALEQQEEKAPDYLRKPFQIIGAANLWLQVVKDRGS